MIKYVFFDLDGTIIDSCEGVTNAVAYSLKKFNIPIKSRESLKSFIGPPLVDSYMQYCSFDRERALKVVETYREYYREIGIFEFKVYDGIKELLQNLRQRGLKLFIATSKPEIFAKQILNKAGLEGEFKGIFGATLDSSRVHKTDVISYALDSLSLNDTAEAIMVGDTCFDILGAKSLGMSSVGVTYGYGDIDELNSSAPDYIVNTPLEILEIL